MSRREELNIFSTSFIDMICVALCSQIILWIIVEVEPAPILTEKRIRYFEISQFGSNHLAQRLNVKGEPYPVPVPAKLHRETGLSGNADYNMAAAKPLIPGGDISGVTLQPLTGNASFAGGIRIFANEDCETFTLEIPIEACEALKTPPDSIGPYTNNLHYIRCETSFLGEKKQVTYYLCETDPDKISQKSPAKFPEDAEYFCKNVIAIPNGGKLQIIVNKRGLISVICDNDDQLTRTVRKESEALARKLLPRP
jgi:hypothetical protein